MVPVLITRSMMRDLTTIMLLSDNGCAVLEGALQGPQVDDLASTLESFERLAYRTKAKVVVTEFLKLAETNDHEAYSAGAVLPYWRIPETHPIRTIYDNHLLFDWLTESLNETLYPYDLPYGAINVIFMKRGDRQNWHRDFCDYTLILILKQTPTSGFFSFRTPSGQEQELRVPDGSLVLIRGKNVSHAVGAVEEFGMRISITWAFSRTPNVTSSKLVRELRYGDS